MIKEYAKILYLLYIVTKKEKDLLEDALTRAAKAAACIVEKGIDKAMNEYNIRLKKEEKND